MKFNKDSKHLDYCDFAVLHCIWSFDEGLSDALAVS